MSDTPEISGQADRVIAKFGGATRLARAIRIDVSAVYRWTYSRLQGGSDGRIPTNSIQAVLNAAELFGIELTDEDLSPR